MENDQEISFSQTNPADPGRIRIDPQAASRTTDRPIVCGVRSLSLPFPFRSISDQMDSIGIRRAVDLCASPSGIRTTELRSQRTRFSPRYLLQSLYPDILEFPHHLVHEIAVQYSPSSAAHV